MTLGIRMRVIGLNPELGIAALVLLQVDGKSVYRSNRPFGELVLDPSVEGGIGRVLMNPVKIGNDHDEERDMRLVCLVLEPLQISGRINPLRVILTIETCVMVR